MLLKFEFFELFGKELNWGLLVVVKMENFNFDMLEFDSFMIVMCGG